MARAGSTELQPLLAQVDGGRCLLGTSANRHHDTTYFDMIDACEVLAHEMAVWWLNTRDSGTCATLNDLPYRQHVGNLFDLSRRWHL